MHTPFIFAAAKVDIILDINKSVGYFLTAHVCSISNKMVFSLCGVAQKLSLAASNLNIKEGEIWPKWPRITSITDHIL